MCFPFEVVPDSLGDLVFDCEIGGCDRLNIPQLEVDLRSLLQVPVGDEKEEADEDAEANNRQAFSALRVDSAQRLAAVVLKIDTCGI